MPSGLLPFGIQAKVGKAIGDTSINSKNASGAQIGQTVTNGVSGTANAYTAESGSTEATVSMTPVEGLTLKADYFDPGSIGGSTVKQDPESGHWSAKYAAGAWSVGYGKGHIATAIGGTTAASTYEDYETTSMGVGFAVNENLSVSWTEEESTLSYTDTTADVILKVTSIQGAYTMGGLTIALSMDDIENSGYTSNKDENETMLTFTFAF